MSDHDLHAAMVDWAAVADAWRSRADTARRWAKQAVDEGKIAQSFKLLVIAACHDETADEYEKLAAMEREAGTL